MRPFNSQFVSLRGRRTHLRVWGEDKTLGTPTIVCLHGWGDVGATFQFLVDALDGNWRVVAPDWRGFGMSQWNGGAYWFTDYLADLDALLEHLSPDVPVRLVGHSMGGIVASLYAGIRPQRVSQLVNIEGHLAANPADAAAGRVDQWLAQNRAPAPAFRPYASRSAFAARLRADNPRLTPERAIFLAEQSLQASGEGFVFAADPHHRWISPIYFPLADAQACWRHIRVPVLWVSGRNSRLAQTLAENPAEASERLSCIADLRELTLDDCGHNVHHDQPQALASALSAFFSA